MLNTKIIGQRMTEARKKINLSQAALAERLFISSQAVGKWERGESMPDILTLNRLADILGVDLNYFSENFQLTSTAVSTVGSPSGATSTDALPLPSGNQEKFPGWDMSHGNWTDADFSGLKNLHEKFSSSNMQRCLFIGSDMSGLLLKGNNIGSCDFSGSDLSSSRIQNSYLSGNLLKNCILQGTEFSGSYVQGCDFSGADFSGTVFNSGGFQGNPVTGAVWKRTSFIESQLADIVFDGRIEDCAFENCAFKKVTFQHATLINTFFKNRSLKRITFVGCTADRMTYEFLKNGKADLTGITLLTA